MAIGAAVNNASETAGDLNKEAWDKYNALRAAILVEHGTDGAHDLIAYITKALFNANTILVANTDDTPAALTITEQRLLGRITGGNIVGLTAAQGRTLLDVYTTGVIAGNRFHNLCRNAAFASRSGGTSAIMDEWALEGTPTVAYDTVDPGYGDFAVKFTASGAGDEGGKITLTHLKVSTKYQVFTRVKVTGGDTASLITTGATTNINEDSTSASWEDITGEFITDGSGTDVVIKLVASADTDVAYFCGITCVEGDIPPGNFIRRVNETIHLITSLTDTDWDGDAKSDDDSTILDLSAFGNGCPPGIKAVLISLHAHDSDSAAGSPVAAIGPIDGQTNMLYIRLAGVVNDDPRIEGAWTPCDTNGDIYIRLDATGGDTLDIHITIYGYILGE